MADNKWVKPSSPPPPLFLGEKERNLVKQVNDELLERVIGQQITYLPISMERTDFHPLYGESIEKCFLPPVRIYALVEFDGIETTTENFGLDKSYSITVKFHERRLQEDQDLYVREGDYVQYGTSFFEIVSLKEDRQLFGQVDHLFQISAKCVRTRRGLINLDILPSETVSAILSSEAGASSSIAETAAISSVVRVVYCATSDSIIPAGTSLNTFLGITEDLKLAKSAVYESGLRQKLTDSAITGEYYIDCGSVFNTFEIASDMRVALEVLTLI